MTRNWNRIITAALCAIGVGQAWAQAPRVASLDIEWENAVVYIDDLADPFRLVTSPNPVTASVRNFMPYIAMADIVSVNGKPAKGAWVVRGRIIQLFPNPESNWRRSSGPRFRPRKF